MLVSELAASWIPREHRLRNGGNLFASIWTKSESVWVMLPLNTVIFLWSDGLTRATLGSQRPHRGHNLTHVGLGD